MGKNSLGDAFHVTYNGVQDSNVGVSYSNKGLHVSNRPSIPAAREVVNTFTIPGRDGTLNIRDGSVEDITITVEFSFTAYPDTWQEMAYAIRDWLLGHVGAVLRFSDLSGIFYKVKRVELSEVSRAYKKVGTISVAFICDGYQYLDSGLIAVSPGTITNAYAISHPTYNITGNGVCTLTVGSKSITATVSQNLTVDTDRMMAYRLDSGRGVINNTALAMGNYSYRSLWLPHGSTSVSASSGFTLEIVPNWRRL